LLRNNKFLRLKKEIINLYIIKIKGKAKIPDYLQVRDDNFTLIAYTRTDRPEKALEKCGFYLLKSVMILNFFVMEFIDFVASLLSS
jgi:hypothetical protein